MNSENDAVSVLLKQKESLFEKVKEYLTCLGRINKAYKERVVVQGAWEAIASELHFIEDAIYAISFYHKEPTILDCGRGQIHKIKENRFFYGMCYSRFFAIFYQ